MGTAEGTGCKIPSSSKIDRFLDVCCVRNLTGLMGNRCYSNASKARRVWLSDRV